MQIVLALLAAIYGYAPEASDELKRLAYAGTPEPLAELLGGTAHHGSSGVMPNLSDGQHMAPHYVKLEDGTIIQMVAPTVNPDWFIVAYPDGPTLVFDYSDNFE